MKRGSVGTRAWLRWAVPGIAVAVVLLLATIGIVMIRQSNDRAEEARKIEAAKPEAQIKMIESNPNMPPQAKAMALQQMRAHSQETHGRSEGVPHR